MRTRCADISRLLEETPEAYYWIGFLLADGYITDKLVKLHLAEADRTHLQKYAEFVRYCGRAKSCCINVRHPAIAQSIREKFNIPLRKTYNPCHLPPINEEMLFSLFIGMIDGDGSMRERNGYVYTIEIKMHRSWAVFLRKMQRFFYVLFKKECTKDLVRVNKRGYSLLILSHSGLIGCLKKKAIELKLPIMERKWAKADATRTLGIQEKMLIKENDYRVRLARGQTSKQIAEETNQKYNSVYMFIRRRKL